MLLNHVAFQKAEDEEGSGTGFMVPIKIPRTAIQFPINAPLPHILVFLVSGVRRYMCVKGFPSAGRLMKKW